MNGVLIFFGVGTLVWIIIPDVYVAYAPKLFALRYTLVASILVFGFTSAIKYAWIDGRKSLIFALSYTLFFFSIVAKILR